MNASELAALKIQLSEEINKQRELQKTYEEAQQSKSLLVLTLLQN